jgi:hypothetical protein
MEEFEKMPLMLTLSLSFEHGQVREGKLQVPRDQGHHFRVSHPHVSCHAPSIHCSFV